MANSGWWENLISRIATLYYLKCPVFNNKKSWSTHTQTENDAQTGKKQLTETAREVSNLIYETDFNQQL